MPLLVSLTLHSLFALVSPASSPFYAHYSNVFLLARSGLPNSQVSALFSLPFEPTHVDSD